MFDNVLRLLMTVFCRGDFISPLRALSQPMEGGGRPTGGKGGTVLPEAFYGSALGLLVHPIIGIQSEPDAV